MNTPITNGLLNTISHAKHHGVPMAEIRMTGHTYDRLRAEGANELYIPTPSKPQFAGLPIIIDDRHAS